MAIHFHKLKVKNITRETENCVSIAFNIPAELKTDFVFSHGQSITLKAIINGKDIRRSYSICSAPFENELRIAVKKAYNGLFSTYINEELKEGDIFEVLPPTGKFNTPLNRENKKHYLAFAAGSGITPILSIIKSTLQAEADSEFTLVYGNQARNSIIFFDELQGLKNKNISRFNIINILSRERTGASINSGRINNEKLNELKKLFGYKGFDEFFICGPDEMIFCVIDFLEKEGIDKNKLHFELFTIPGEKKKLKKPITNTETTVLMSKVAIKVDGVSFNFDLSFNGLNILDAALQQGADLPFACKGGVCASCKAKLIEGEISMDVNYALEPEEIKQGFILCCQSHPITKKVVIDFDIK